MTEGRYCTNIKCLYPTPKFYRVVLNEVVVDEGLCFGCAHDLLLTLPVEATIEEDKEE